MSYARGRWWMPEWPLEPDEKWEHAFVGNGADCLRCGEGRQMYLHDDHLSSWCCTICLYFSELRHAVVAYARPCLDLYEAIPVFYCANHFEQADLELFVLNVARHAGEDPMELLDALYEIHGWGRP